jgi:hypothetical protein
MVAAAESVNVVDFAPIAGHVGARVRAAAIFGPDVVPTPARCHNGIWAGVSGSLIGSPGHLAGTWTCSVGQPRAWRTIDSCALPSMTSSGAAWQCWQANTSSATLTPTHWAYFGHEIRFADLSTVSELRKRRCAILGLKAWRVETPGLRCPGCYLGRSTRPPKSQADSSQRPSIGKRGSRPAAAIHRYAVRKRHDECLVLDFRDTAGVERRVAQHGPRCWVGGCPDNEAAKAKAQQRGGR